MATTKATTLAHTLASTTSSTADLNYAKTLNDTGVTSTEFNKLDGLTATTNELNLVDGLTATTNELNLVDGSVSGPLSHRNMIINGAMQVWQRSTDITCSDGSNEDYNSVDRWQPNFNGGCPGTLDIDRSTDTPDGFGYSQKLKCNATGTPTGANQMSHWRYKIEAQDLQQLNYGSSSAKVMTFSWYMKSVNYTSPLSFLFIKGDNTGAYYVKAVSPTTSWARYSLTIPANTNSGHGIDNDNGEGMIINIMLSGTSGGTYERTGDSTAWGTSVDYYTNTQGNFFSSTSNELYITGVQLELGSVATPFEHRTYGEELQRCMRYYTVLGSLIGTGYQNGSTQLIVPIGDAGVKDPSNAGGMSIGSVPFRAPPTISGTLGTASFANHSGNAEFVSNPVSTIVVGTTGTISVTTSSNFSTNGANDNSSMSMYYNGKTIDCSAEL